jgi:hypothetical protein
MSPVAKRGNKAYAIAPAPPVTVTTTGFLYLFSTFTFLMSLPKFRENYFYLFG